LERFSEKIAENNLLYFVIGNKNDLNSVVSKELIDKKLSTIINATYFETSAKTGQNINETFNEIAKKLSDKQEGIDNRLE